MGRLVSIIRKHDGGGVWWRLPEWRDFEKKMQGGRLPERVRYSTHLIQTDDSGNTQ